MIIQVNEKDKDKEWIESVTFKSYNTYTAELVISLRQPMTATMGFYDEDIIDNNRIISLDSDTIEDTLMELLINTKTLAEIKIIPETALDKHLISHSIWDKQYSTSSSIFFFIQPVVSSPKSYCIEKIEYTNRIV